MASDAIGELVSAADEIYFWSGRTFCGWDQQAPRLTPDQFQADRETRTRLLDRFEAAHEAAKAVPFRDIVPFEERHRRIERIRESAYRAAYGNDNWNQRMATLPGFYEAELDWRSVVAAAGDWFLSVQEDFRHELDWWSDLRSQLAALVEPEPAPEDAPGQAEVEEVACDVEPSSDFRWVRWGEQSFTFTPTEAACVKILFDSRRDGVPVLGQLEILDRAGSNGDRLRDVFRKNGKMNPAWGTLIVQADRKGLYRIADPHESGVQRSPR